VTAEALRLDRERRASAFLFAVRGRLEALRGDLRAASGHLDRARELGAGEDPDLDAYVARGLAEVALAGARPQEAVRAVEAGLGRPAESHAPSLRVSLLALGARAATDVRQAAGHSPGKSGDLPGVSAVLATELSEVDRTRLPDATVVLLDLADAELARAAEADPGRWAALAERFDGAGDRYLGAYARLRATEADLRLTGTRGDAGRYLRPAAAAAHELGALPLQREIAGLARRARIPLDVDSGGAAPELPEAPASPGPVLHEAHDGAEGTAALRQAGLSAREVEVLRLVAAGRTNGEIAERLFISRKTAGVHVTHILDKLDVTNRVEAAMVAARLGLEPEAGD
jgi:DNA-binding CsgD family transcriptional regulator